MEGFSAALRPAAAAGDDVAAVAAGGVAAAVAAGDGAADDDASVGVDPAGKKRHVKQGITAEIVLLTELACVNMDCLLVTDSADMDVESDSLPLLL